MKDLGYVDGALPVLLVWADIQERRPEFKDFTLIAFEQNKIRWRATFQNNEMAVGLEGLVSKMRVRLGMEVSVG